MDEAVTRQELHEAKP
ncbi:unnamed protein product, partial [Didymodactylos carnosus]